MCFLNWNTYVLLHSGNAEFIVITAYVHHMGVRGKRKLLACIIILVLLTCMLQYWNISTRVVAIM
jgi:hypothetical protein